MSRTFVSLGEAMVELAVEADGRYRRGFAGDTLNTAWAVRALAAPDIAVRYVTAIGHDAMSDALDIFLTEAGIDTRHIRRIEGRNIGLYLISLEGHERTFHYWRDASAARLLAADPAALVAAVADAEMIYLSGITLAILAPDDRAALFAILTAFRARGGAVAFDGNVRLSLWTGHDEAREGLERAYRIADIALPTAEDEAALFGDRCARDTAERIIGYGVRELAVKCGPGPCLLVTPEGRSSIPAEVVMDAMDTSGAGDSFNGAYLASRLEGRSPVDAAGRAHRVAARVIRTRGAIVDMARLAEAGAWL